MPSALRTRLGQGAALAAALGILLHGLGAYVAYSRTAIFSDGSEVQTPGASSLTWSTVLSSMGSLSIALAVAMAAGVVASLVIEEGLERRLWMDAGLDEDEDESDEDDDDPDDTD